MSIRAEPPGDWCMGEGSGEDVEFCKEQPFDNGGGPAPTDHYFLERILYFFEHRGNKCPGDLERP